MDLLQILSQGCAQGCQWGLWSHLWCGLGKGSVFTLIEWLFPRIPALGGVLDWGPQLLTNCGPEATLSSLLCGSHHHGSFFSKTGKRLSQPARRKSQSFVSCPRCNIPSMLLYSTDSRQVAQRRNLSIRLWITGGWDHGATAPNSIHPAIKKEGRKARKRPQRRKKWGRQAMKDRHFKKDQKVNLLLVYSRIPLWACYFITLAPQLWISYFLLKMEDDMGLFIHLG